MGDHGEMNTIETIEVDDPQSIALRLAARIARLSKEVSKKARALIDVKKICDPIEFRNVYAIDSAYPSRPLDLVGLSLSLVAVVLVKHVYNRGTEAEYERKLIVSYFSELDQDMVAAIAREAERTIALRVLRDADVLIIDGEIVPYKRAQNYWRKPVSLAARLLDEASRLQVPVVGVIKRSYSSDLAKRLGLNLNDKSIASMVLRRGEYLELEPSLALLREKGCKIVFYKPLKGLSEAIKLEVCPFNPSMDLCQLVSYLSRNAGASGLPWIIDIVDSLSKQQVSLVEAIRRLLLGKLATRGEEGIVVAYPTNPQERGRQ